METKIYKSNEIANGVNHLLAAGGIIFIIRDTAEWEYMWSELAKDEINKDNKEPTVCENFGERWQYMGTSLETNTFKKQRKIIHCFRHRNHPNLYDSRYYINIPLSENFNPNVDCDAACS